MKPRNHRILGLGLLGVVTLYGASSATPAGPSSIAPEGSPGGKWGAVCGKAMLNLNDRVCEPPETTCECECDAPPRQPLECRPQPPCNHPSVARLTTERDQAITKKNTAETALRKAEADAKAAEASLERYRALFDRVREEAYTVRLGDPAREKLLELLESRP